MNENSAAEPQQEEKKEEAKAENPAVKERYEKYLKAAKEQVEFMQQEGKSSAEIIDQLAIEFAKCHTQHSIDGDACEMMEEVMALTALFMRKVEAVPISAIPRWNEMNKAVGDFIKFQDKFGRTPGERAQIKVMEVSAGDLPEVLKELLSNLRK